MTRSYWSGQNRYFPNCRVPLDSTGLDCSRSCRSLLNSWVGHSLPFSLSRLGWAAPLRPLTPEDQPPRCRLLCPYSCSTQDVYWTMDFLLLQPHPGQEIEILTTDITGPILDSSLAPRRNMLLGVCAQEGFRTKLLISFP